MHDDFFSGSEGSGNGPGGVRKRAGGHKVRLGGVMKDREVIPNGLSRLWWFVSARKVTGKDEGM